MLRDFWWYNNYHSTSLGWIVILVISLEFLKEGMSSHYPSRTLIQIGSLYFFHPYQCIWSGKSGVSSQDHFYWWDPLLWTKVWNLLGAFWGIKRQFLWVNIFFSSTTHFNSILHIDTFPTVHESPHSEFVCKHYATQKLTFMFSHLWFGRMPHQPPLFMEKWLAMCLWSKLL